MSSSQVEINLCPVDIKQDKVNEEEKSNSNIAKTSENNNNETVLDLVEECDQKPNIIRQVLSFVCNKGKYRVRDVSTIKKSPEKLNNTFSKHKTWVQFSLGDRYGETEATGPPFHYDPDSRNGYIKLVFFLLFICLVVTAVYLFVVHSTPDLKEMYIKGGYILIICLCVSLLVLDYAILCIPATREGVCSYVCLVIGVILMTNLASAITARYKTEIILLALIATAITVFVCFLLACSRFDFTKWYLYFVVIVAVFSAVSMVIYLTMAITKTRFKPLTIALTFIGSLLNVISIIMLLQMVLGGRTVELSENQHAFAAYMLYMSIVQLFLRLMQLIGAIDS